MAQKTFSTKLKHVSLVIEYDQHTANIPKLSQKQEELLYAIIGEFAGADNTAATFRQRRELKAAKIVEILRGVDVVRIHDEKRNFNIVFFKSDDKPTIEQLIERLGESQIDIIRASINTESVVPVHLPLQEGSDIDDFIDRLTKWAARHGAYLKVDQRKLFQDSVDQEKLKFLCKQRGKPFPADLFRQQKNLRKYDKPKKVPIA